MSDKYDASGSVEGLFEPGSNDTVLANKLGVVDDDEMGNIELDKLLIAQEHILGEINDGESISCKHLREWHKRWLGDVYLWAGNYRSVNMSKDEFHFAASHLVHGLMDKFENQYLSKFTPSKYVNEETITEELAITHVEFILIHPFRDGNGRLGRLVMTIMALQAGLGGDYEPMKKLVSNVLKASLLND